MLKDSYILDFLNLVIIVCFDLNLIQIRVYGMQGQKTWWPKEETQGLQVSHSTCLLTCTVVHDEHYCVIIIEDDVVCMYIIIWLIGSFDGEFCCG